MPYFSLIILFFGVVLFSLLFPKLQKNLIFFIIPINVLADIFMQFFSEENEIHSGFIRASIMMAIILLYIRKVKSNRLNLIILVFLIYLGILIFLSSNFTRSLNTYIKVVFSFSLIPISFYTIKNQNAFKKLQISLIFSVALALVNFGLAQIFNLGKKEYSEEMFYLGGMGVYITYLFAYALVLSPLGYYLLQKKSSRLLTIIMYALSTIIVVVTFRRGAIIALMIGFTILLLMGHWKIRVQIVKILALGLIVFFICFLLYGNVISSLFQQRIVQGIPKEFESTHGRVNETRVVWKELFHKSLKHTFFGTELFNTRDYFYDWKREGRPIHIDYNIILHGSGIIGLALFLIIFWMVIKLFYRLQKYFPDAPFYKRLKPTFWAVLAISFILSCSNQLWVLTSYSIFCMNIGAMLRMATNAKRVYKEYIIQRKNYNGK